MFHSADEIYDDEITSGPYDDDNELPEPLDGLEDEQ